MFSLLAGPSKRKRFPSYPSRKKKLLKFKRESTCSRPYVPRIFQQTNAEGVRAQQRERYGRENGPDK